MCKQASKRRRVQQWCRRFRRARRYVAAFSLQLYLTGMFGMFAVVRLVDPAGFAVAPVWPVAYTATMLVLAAGIIRPFSRRLAAAGGALIAAVSAARIGALLEVAWRAPVPGIPFGTLVAGTLWGAVVVIGLRWPRVAWDSGVRHLIDVGSSEAAPPEPEYRALPQGG